MSGNPGDLGALAADGGALIYVCDTTGADAQVTSASVDDVAKLTSRATAAVALARDIERATRHLGLVDWMAVSVECESGSLSLARGTPGSMAVVSAPGSLHPGLVNRLAARAARASGASRAAGAAGAATQ